jgi:hypothetical protein
VLNGLAPRRLARALGVGVGEHRAKGKCLARGRKKTSLRLAPATLAAVRACSLKGGTAWRQRKHRRATSPRGIVARTRMAFGGGALRLRAAAASGKKTAIDIFYAMQHRAVLARGSSRAFSFFAARAGGGGIVVAKNFYVSMNSA